MTTRRIVKIATLVQLQTAQADFPHTPDTPENSPFLRLLLSAGRDQLSNSFTEMTCYPGEIVFREGEPGDSLFLIRAGRVAIVKGNLNSPTILAYRGPGELIGEMALLDNQPRSATVVALGRLSLLSINRQRFEQLLTENPAVGRGIMEMLSAQLRRMSEARSTGELSAKRLSQQINALETERQRLQELQRLRQETTDLIIHDLRNPLSAITVALKMLSIVLPPDVLNANEELLNIAQASAERLSRLVDSLLEVSRMESGEAQFRMAACDLGPMLEEAARRSLILARQGVQVQVEVEPGLPPAQADHERLERVLANLVDNALKYTPENGRIRLSARTQADALLVSVIDSGPGVPPADRQRIFDRFTQGSGDTLSRRGFGLGLAYCRLAIERHNGRIWVEPGDGGQGSCFSFTLPCAAP